MATTTTRQRGNHRKSQLGAHAYCQLSPKLMKCRTDPGDGPEAVVLYEDDLCCVVPLCLLPLSSLCGVLLGLLPVGLDLCLSLLLRLPRLLGLLGPSTRDRLVRRLRDRLRRSCDGRGLGLLDEVGRVRPVDEHRLRRGRVRRRLRPLRRHSARSVERLVDVDGRACAQIGVSSQPQLREGKGRC